MGHSHSHHHHPQSDQTEKRLWITIILNLGIPLAQVVGGILSNSLALISDALHNFSDTTSLVISLGARKISKWSPDKNKTFGYKRAEIIGAFINLMALVFIAFFLIKEGVERLFAPEGVDGIIVMWIALISVVGNVISVMILHADSKENINIKSAYIHLFWDAVSSVAVIIAGLLIWQYEFYIIDPILTIAIALYILWHSYHLLREIIDILMESTPPELSVADIKSSIETVPRVLDAHHIHVWNLNEHHRLLECHIFIRRDDLPHMEEIKSEIKNLLLEEFSITHSTLEFELEPCGEIHHHA